MKAAAAVMLALAGLTPPAPIPAPRGYVAPTYCVVDPAPDAGPLLRDAVGGGQLAELLLPGSPCVRTPQPGSDVMDELVELPGGAS